MKKFFKDIFKNDRPRILPPLAPMRQDEIEDFKYVIQIKLLKRFYERYEDGKKQGHPKGYIEYFSASNFLLCEVQEALKYQDRISRESFIDKAWEYIVKSSREESWSKEEFINFLNKK